MQVNSARGDSRTVLPDGFERPSHWANHGRGTDATERHTQAGR
jgi:hypothetical protein